MTESNSQAGLRTKNLMMSVTLHDTQQMTVTETTKHDQHERAETETA